MNYEDKNSFPGYIYFRDNGMDYKIGLTNNLVVRGRAYKTENPRDTVVDYFQVETYAEAEAIEDEMKKAARAEGRCSFDNSDEWLVRDNLGFSEDFWRRFVQKYAKKTHAEWDDSDVNKHLRAKLKAAEEQWDHFRQMYYDTRDEKEKEIAKLNASRHLLQGAAETEEKLKAAQVYIARLEASLKGLRMNYAKVTNDLKSDIEHLEQEIRKLNGDIDESVSENMIPNCLDFF